MLRILLNKAGVILQSNTETTTADAQGTDQINKKFHFEILIKLNLSDTLHVRACILLM